MKIVFPLLLLILVACSGTPPSSDSDEELYVLEAFGKKRPVEGRAECPDDWVFSMRQTEEYPPGESIIINGELLDPEEFDTVWIEQNCNMEARVVG